MLKMIFLTSEWHVKHWFTGQKPFKIQDMPRSNSKNEATALTQAPRFRLKLA